MAKKDSGTRTRTSVMVPVGSLERPMADVDMFYHLGNDVYGDPMLVTDVDKGVKENNYRKELAVK
jgi:hypothetical protein